MWDDTGNTPAFTQEPVDWKPRPAALAGEIHSRRKERIVRYKRYARLASLGLAVVVLLVTFLVSAAAAGMRFPPHRVSYKEYEAYYIRPYYSLMSDISSPNRHSIHDDAVTVDEEHMLALERLYERLSDLLRQRSEIYRKMLDDAILSGQSFTSFTGFTEKERAAIESNEEELRSFLPEVYRQEALIIDMKCSAYLGQLMLASLPNLIFFVVLAAAGFFFLPLYLDRLYVDFQKKTLS